MMYGFNAKLCCQTCLQSTCLVLRNNAPSQHTIKQCTRGWMEHVSPDSRSSAQEPL